MSLPRAPATLPDDFAAALGHAVAACGFLEEALKRGVHALSLEDLGEAPGEARIDAWVTRMAQIAGDSLGTLIDSFTAALDRSGAEGEVRRRLGQELRVVRELRNMLCHASWHPAPDGGWRPAFVSSRGVVAPDRMEAADLDAIRARTLAAAREVVALARATGRDDWTPDGSAAERAAARARARARSARSRVEARR